MRAARPTPLLAAATAAVTLTACLPERDNPQDPANRPAAVLNVDSGPFDNYEGECEPATESSVTTVTRGQCLHLTAEGTTDPQGDALVRCRFTLLASPPIAVSSSCGSAAVVISSTALRAVGVGEYELLLEVEDARGDEGSTSTTLSLANTVPTAVSPGLRVVNNWGAAWRSDPGGSWDDRPNLRVHFSGASSVDDDGDRLFFCWSVVKGAERLANGSLPVGMANDSIQASARAMLVPNSQCFESPDLEVEVEPIPGGESDSITLQLQVVDDWTVSNVARSTVVLSSIPGWAIEEQTGNAAIYDLARKPFVINSNYRGAPSIRFNPAPAGSFGASVLFYDHGGTNQIGRHRLDAPYGDVDVVTLGQTDAILETALSDTASGILWVFGQSNSGRVVVHAVDESSQPNLVVLDTYESATAFPSGSDSATLKVHPTTRDLWALIPFSQNAFVFRWNPNTFQIEERAALAPGTGRFLTGLSFRQPSAAGAEVEAWVFESRNVFAGQVADPTAVVYYDEVLDEAVPAGIEVPLSADALTVDPTIGTSFEFFGPEQSMVNLFDDGIATFDVCDFTDEAMVTNTAAVADIPTPAALNPTPALCLRDVEADFLPGLAHVLGRNTNVLVQRSITRYQISRFVPGGLATNSPDSLYRIKSLEGPDAEDGIWVFTENEGLGGAVKDVVYRGAGTPAEGLILRNPVPIGFSRPAIDFSTGDLWVSNALSASAVRISPDGREIDRISRVLNPQTGGEPVPLMPPSVIASDPQTGEVWIVDGGGGATSTGGGTRVFLVNPYLYRPDAATVITAMRTDLNPPLNVPAPLTLSPALVDEYIVDALSRPQGSDLVLLTRSTAQGTCAAPAAADSNNYFLRVLTRDGALSAAVCVVESFAQSAGDDRVRFARDLSTGDVCTVHRVSVSPKGALIQRFAGNPLQLRASGMAHRGYPGVDQNQEVFPNALVADPQRCWLGASDYDGSGEYGRLWLLPFASGLNQVPYRSNPGLVPLVAGIRTLPSLAEVQGQVGIRNAWVGGEGDSITLVNVATNGAITTIDPIGAFPESSVTSLIEP